MKRASDHARLVYSTDPSRRCAVCGWPAPNCACSRKSSREDPVPARVVAKLRIEKAGRGGKTVTVIYDLPRNPGFLKELAGELKRACGAGGTVGEDSIEIQGELRDRVRRYLTGKGIAVKG